MLEGNSGGQLAAPIWHDFMAVAHRDMNIPTIAGLDPHPVQIAEQQRIAELQRTDPALAAALSGESAGGKSSSLMTDETRQSLSALAADLRQAAGLPPAAAEPQPTEPPQRQGAAPAPQGPQPPQKASALDLGTGATARTRP